MLNKLSLIALAGVAFAFASAPPASAGVEMVEPEYAPAPRYNYVPPRPAIVYYAPPPPVVLIARGYGYHRPYYRGHRHHRFYGGRGHWRGGHHRRY